MIMEILKGVWAFCLYLFVPQRRPYANAEGTVANPSGKTAGHGKP